MKRWITGCLLTAAMTLCVTGAAPAIIGAPVNLKTQAKYADIICVGRVLKTIQGWPGANANADYETRFRVDRVMKGDIEPNTTIRIFYSQQACYPRYSLSGYDLLLLKKKDGKLTFAQSSYSSLLVKERVCSTYVRSEDVEKNLRWEIMNTLQASLDEHSPTILIQPELLASPDCMPFLKKFASSPYSASRPEALKALALARDKDSIVQAVDLVVKVYAKAPNEMDFATVDLAHTLESVPVPAESIPVLGKAITSPAVKVRVFASRLLKSSKSNAAIPYMRMALADTDQDVRYHAVMGLAALAEDNAHAPMFSLYKSNEPEYLGYWKSKSADMK